MATIFLWFMGGVAFELWTDEIDGEGESSWFKFLKFAVWPAIMATLLVWVVVGACRTVFRRV